MSTGEMILLIVRMGIAWPIDFASFCLGSVADALEALSYKIYPQNEWERRMKR